MPELNARAFVFKGAAHPGLAAAVLNAAPAFNTQATATAVVPPASPALMAASPALMAMAEAAPNAFIAKRMEWMERDEYRQLLMTALADAGAPRRENLAVPIAPSQTPSDTDVFEHPSGAELYVLPRYELAFDRVGLVDEPRIAIRAGSGVAVLVVTLLETPSPASPSRAALELPHVLGVTLRYRVPVNGTEVVKSLEFPSVTLDATNTVVTAELPLVSPGLRQQILAALGSLGTGTTLVVTRSITVGVPTDESRSDGARVYRPKALALDWIVQPAPLVLSDAQRARLGGGDTQMQPLLRHVFPFRGQSHVYWQDGAQPELFFCVPDRFLLCRAAEGARRLQLRVRGAASQGDDVRLTLEFQAGPYTDPERLRDVWPRLAELVARRGGSGAPRLELLPDPQPVLRLALPENGAPSTRLTERPDAQLDLELGLAHAETLGLEDFKLVYEALLGGSLALLRGDVRVASGSGLPQDVPLELRVERALGSVLRLEPLAATAEGLECRLSNAIESPLRLEGLGALAVHAGQRVALSVERLAPGQRLAPGESVQILLRAPVTIAAAARIELEEAQVVVEPDGAAIWHGAFDRSAGAQLTRTVKARAEPAHFRSPAGSTDSVASFVISVEHGGSVLLNETELEGSTSVRTPIEPLITGAARPPVRYRTETSWASGRVGVSPWRETDAAILVPIKTDPS